MSDAIDWELLENQYKENEAFRTDIKKLENVSCTIQSSCKYNLVHPNN